MKRLKRLKIYKIPFQNEARRVRILLPQCLEFLS